MSSENALHGLVSEQKDVPRPDQSDVVPAGTVPVPVLVGITLVKQTDSHLGNWGFIRNIQILKFLVRMNPWIWIKDPSLTSMSAEISQLPN